MIVRWRTKLARNEPWRLRFRWLMSAHPRATPAPASADAFSPGLAT